MSLGEYTVRNDNAILPLYSLVRNGFRKINSEEDRVHLPSYGIEGSL